MRINNNISALNAWRGLSNTDNSLSKSLEKLSSGLRINRAGDDAAGLAISEKMRGQIRGLNMAVKNAQDGISLIQTAEGALTESHAILQRMRELAVQSSNDTNTLDDRKELQKELNQLIEELNRISDNTEFNTQKLLDGSFEEKIIHIGANTGQAMKIDMASMHSEKMGDQVPGFVATSDGAVKTDYSGEGNDLTFTVTVGNANYNVVLATNFGDNNVEAVLTELNSQLEGSGINATIGESDKIVLQGIREFSTTKFTNSGATAVVALDGPAGLTVFDLQIEDADFGGVLTQVNADSAISIIDGAIQTVSAERSKLGAFQNRLEHTIKNLGVASENLAAAESRIRDVDMAAEMMNFTKQNILMQAGTAMLAQANARPQSVLQLLG